MKTLGCVLIVILPFLDRYPQPRTCIALVLVCDPDLGLRMTPYVMNLAPSHMEVEIPSFVRSQVGIATVLEFSEGLALVEFVLFGEASS